MRISLLGLLLFWFGCADAVDNNIDASSWTVPSVPFQIDYGLGEQTDGRVADVDADVDAATVEDAMRIADGCTK